jgi:hypothetical protein
LRWYSWACLAGQLPGRAVDPHQEDRLADTLRRCREHTLGCRTDHDPRHRAIGDLAVAQRDVGGRRLTERRREHVGEPQLHPSTFFFPRNAKVLLYAHDRAVVGDADQQSAAGQRDGDLAKGPEWVIR